LNLVSDFNFDYIDDDNKDHQNQDENKIDIGF